MGIKTKIEWCDSSTNIQMGCDGCELWNPKAGIKHCYAGTLTERWGGKNKGWPVSFDQPTTFPHRLETALNWPDLTGTERPDKPWLNGYPRLIFLNDMGDTFTESLTLDWLDPYIPEMSESPHIFQVLTKRPGRMLKYFSQLGYIPDNFWLMTSITTQATVKRIAPLLKLKTINPKVVLGLSVEPLLGPIDLTRVGWPGLKTHRVDVLRGGFWGMSGFVNHSDFPGTIDWIVVGGESGAKARPMNIHWATDIVEQYQAAGAKVFVKQLGSNPAKRILEPVKVGGWQDKKPIITPLKLKDSKGGNWDEWPEELRVREMPEARNRQGLYIQANNQPLPDEMPF